MSTSGTRILISLLLWTAVATCCNSCGPYTSASAPKELQNVGQTMDRLAADEAEFGTMGISSPVLAKPSDTFAFDVNADANAFYNDAKSSRQGLANNFEQEAVSLSAAANVTLNPVAALGFAAQLQQYQQAVSLNNVAQSFADRKNAAYNAAAYQQYEADLLSARNSTTNPADFAQKRAEAYKKLVDSLAGPTATTLPAFPQSSTQPAAPTDLTTRPTDLINQFANNGNFAGFQNLASTRPTLGVTDRTALLTAAGDNAVKAMFKMLGDPKLAEQFRGLKVIYGVSTVSVNPGWRTKKNYAANVAMTVSVTYVPARVEVIRRLLKNGDLSLGLREQIAFDSGLCATRPTTTINADSAVPVGYRYDEDPESASSTGPLVAAVSPMTDTQTLDLESSFRQQQDFALNLAFQLLAAGQTGQAQTVFKYAHSLQQDFATVSPDVVVNSYSTGPIFGFQVGPRLKAVEEAARGKASGPADVLDRQSFPTLIMMGFAPDDLHPRIRARSESGRVHYDVYEPAMKLDGVNQWVLMDHPWYEDILGGNKQLTETERLNLSYDVNRHVEALEQLKDRVDRQSPALQRVTGLAKLRTDALKTEVFGGGAIEYLPIELQSDQHPEITAAQPSQMTVGQDITIALIGADLDSIDAAQISILQPDPAITTLHDAQDPTPSKRPQTAHGVVQLTFTPSKAGTFLIQLMTPYGDKLLSPTLTIKAAPTTPLVKLVSPDTVTLKTGADGKPLADTFPILLAGTGLDQIAIDAITPAGQKGNATVLSGDQAPKLFGGALQVTLKVENANAPIVLQLPLKAPNQDQAVLALPILVKVVDGPNAPKKPDRDVIERSFGPSDPKASRSTDHIEFTPNVSPDVVKSAIENPPTPPTAPKDK